MGSFIIYSTLLLMVSLFFLPISLHTNLYFDTKSGKIGCNLILYGIIKVVGGYLLPCSGGFAWHISKRKAVVFSYRNINDERRNLSTNKAFQVRKFKVITEISPQYLMSISIMDGILKIVVPFLHRNVCLENTIVLRGEDGIRVFAKIKFTIHIWQLAIKYLFERGKTNVKRQN